MEKKEEKKKESSLSINDDFDFIFAKKIPSALRWLLVLPVGILSVLLVHLAYGFIVSMFLKNFSETSVVVTIVNAIFALVKFFIFEISMVAMAPVSASNKFKAGVVLAIIPLALAGIIVHLSRSIAGDLFTSTDALIQIGAVVVAVVIALINIKKETSKEKSVAAEQTIED